MTTTRHTASQRIGLVGTLVIETGYPGRAERRRLEREQRHKRNLAIAAIGR